MNENSSAARLSREKQPAKTGGYDPPGLTVSIDHKTREPVVPYLLLTPQQRARFLEQLKRSYEALKATVKRFVIGDVPSTLLQGEAQSHRRMIG
jgi:hypothetical protein